MIQKNNCPPHLLLVWYKGVVVWETVWQLLKGLNSYFMTQQFHSWVHYPENLKTRPCKNRCTDVHRSIIHNSQTVKTIQIPITRWTEKQNVVQPSDGTLLSREKQWGAGTCYDTGEPRSRHAKQRSQAQKTIYCVILFIWNVQNRQIHRGRK